MYDKRAIFRTIIGGIQTGEGRTTPPPNSPLKLSILFIVTGDKAKDRIIIQKQGGRRPLRA